MARARKSASTAVGVADHAGWAVLVTVAGGALLDRRRVELVDAGLPSLPHHHACQSLPMPEAVALVARVRGSAERHAREALATLASEVPHDITAIAIRACPPLPDTVEERITNYRAQNVADTVMFRHALAKAATERGWRISWYEPTRVFAAAAAALDVETIDDLLDETGGSSVRPGERITAPRWPRRSPPRERRNTWTEPKRA